MNKLFRYFAIALFITWGAMSLGRSLAFADEGNKGSITVTNRNASVKGDAGKFRAHHWMKDGFSGGIGEMTFDEKVGKDIDFSFEGHSIPAENDHEAAILFKKGDAGFLKTEYTSFRKYFSDVGGVFPPFNLGNGARLTDQQLNLDMGHFALEAGLGSEYYPDLSLMYEHHTKKGKKSRLTWTAVKEKALSKSIGPAWQQVDETADIVTLKGKKEIAGVTIKDEQRAEFVSSRNYREERSLSPTSGLATDFKVRAQEQKPEARALSSTLRGEKWSLNDNTFMALGYRYNNIYATEKERLQELSTNYTLTNYSTYAEQRLLSDAENRSDEHIWTGNLQTNLSEDWSFISKLKMGYSGREGSSTYPYDSLNATPDGIADNTQASRVENRVNRLGENFSLRYSGIAHTVLYSEVEFEQTRNWLVELRDSIAGTNVASTSEPFNRETVTNIQKETWTMGGRVIPYKWFNMTAQVRRRAELNDYDDVRESANTDSLAKSAFFEELKIKGDEAETKLTWKPYSWLQNSLRYQFLNNKYSPRAETEVHTKSRMLANIITYDVSMQPVDPLLVTVSFSHQELSVKTPAASAASAPLPGFNAGVNSWLVSTSYSPKENLTFNNGFQYSRAANFNDFSATGSVPFGADFTQYDISTGIDWSLKKGVKISPSYQYAAYDANPLVEIGDYSAHIAWLDVSFDW